MPVMVCSSMPQLLYCTSSPIKRSGCRFVQQIASRFRHVIGGQAGITENADQQIVEIVRDASREYSQSFELLHLPQPVRQDALFRNIACDVGCADDLAFAIENRRDRDRDID